MADGGVTRILLIAARPAIRREVGRLLVEAGLRIEVTPTIAEAISVVVLDCPSFVVFDSHLAVSEGAHAVTALVQLLEGYGVRAVDFALSTGADENGLEGAGRPAPLRPRPHPPSLNAAAHLPDASFG